MDKKFTILVVMNIILMILCSSLLIKGFVEDSAVSEVPANLQRADDEPAGDELVREEKVSSALEKLSISGEPASQFREPVALLESDIKTEVPLDVVPEVADEPDSAQDQAQLAAQSAEAQSIYQEQADLYKQRLLAN